MWNNFFDLTNLLMASWFHFVASAWVAVLGFSLTQTILFAVYPIFHFPASQARVIKFFILGLGLLCAGLSAWYVHTRLDAFVGWWTAPLNPPLTIIK